MVADVVDEVNRVHAAGVNEVVLAGVHLGGYGSDLQTDLAELVETLLRETDIPRIRLGSLEPWELHDTFWSLFADPRVMPHLHLPIQSGADSVLRRMSRRCRTAEFASLVDQARAAAPGFNVTTDIIVGYPGETDAEWQQTLTFTESIGFGHIHIFAYSPRSGTKAAALPDPVSREVKRARSQQLHELAEQGRRQVLEHAIGQPYPVLFEHSETDDSGNQYWVGYTPNYLRVQVPATDHRDLGNTLHTVHATGLSEDQKRLQAVMP